MTLKAVRDKILAVGRVAQWQSSGLLSHWLRVRASPRSLGLLIRDWLLVPLKPALQKRICTLLRSFHLFNMALVGINSITGKAGTEEQDDADDRGVIAQM